MVDCSGDSGAGRRLNMLKMVVLVNGGGGVFLNSGTGRLLNMHGIMVPVCGGVRRYHVVC